MEGLDQGVSEQGQVLEWKQSCLEGHLVPMGHNSGWEERQS